ncbi:Calmodulin-binding protein 60 C [Dichanthelium oligosanthes]|uniref:Calmodulin-binding protein 60 C n=1 Tax=Dichanthelium oligosanthes TaxID=888268 RepID=A0A1E5W526_9POAL|nr:Calmodulin-binding protein 60 C [Dichanthelium oligosanthes]
MTRKLLHRHQPTFLGIHGRSRLAVTAWHGMLDHWRVERPACLLTNVTPAVVSTTDCSLNFLSDLLVKSHFGFLHSFYSIVRRAVAQETIQQIVHNLEPLIRRVVRLDHSHQYVSTACHFYVREEIQNIFAQHDHIPLRSLPLRIQEAGVLPPLKLVFAKKLNLPIFTNNKLVDIVHNAMEIQLIDTRTNCIIAPPDTHLGSSVRLEVLVLDGDFCCEHRDGWTADQFNAAIVKAREGKRPLLVGSLNVPMNNHGVAVIDDMSFTDNSSWIRCRKFRIGVRIMPGSHFGARIQEAVSESFTVKDHRGELYKKHFPPLLSDNIWRLKNIGKDGPIDKRLDSEGIRTIQDFLKLNTIGPDKLRALVGMSDKQWNTTLNHAKTCDMGRKCYVFKTVGCDITFNPIGEILAARIGDQTFPLQELPPQQLSHVEQLAAQAYQLWDQLEEVINEMAPAANKILLPSSNSGRQPSDSQESMISSGSQNAKYLDYTGTATSSAAAAMSTNSSSTSDPAAAAPANDAMSWTPSIPPDDQFGWQNSSGCCWDQVD